MIGTESTMSKLTLEESTLFIRKLERKTNAAFRKVKTNERVRFHRVATNEELGRFKYAEIVNDDLIGYVVVASGPNGEAKIVNSYHVSRRPFDPKEEANKRQ